jgi:acetolactate synthase-1/2/3 large subunit
VISVEERTQSAAVTKTMTGGQALVASLIAQGIDTIFALPGVQLDGAFDALHDAVSGGQVRVIHPRHEQTAAYMADGYARVTGRIGTCMVVPGPGLLNASAALATAYACNSPVLCVTGQIQSDLIGVGRGQLHEIPNQLEMIRSVTKFSGRAVEPAAIPNLVNDAVTAMWSGRIRPVEIEIPPDTLFAHDNVTLLPGVTRPERSSGDPDLVEEAARLLGNAQNPLIFAGGGVIRSDATAELLTLAELLQAPVMMSTNGKGAISSRHYLAQNPTSVRALIPDADVILVVGTRFVEASTQPWGPKGERTIIQMDIDPEEIGLNRPVNVGIEADAKAGLAALSERVAAHNLSRPSRETELRELAEAAREKVNSVHPQVDYANAIRAELPDDGICVGEMTHITYWSGLGFPVYEPRTYFTPGYQGTLGWGYPTSLGVKVGAPDKVVVSVNGDGGFGFALNELATQAQHGIASITLVFNDSAFGNVRRIQNVEFDGRTIASDLKNPDYRKLADAFGVVGRRATSPGALRTALNEAIRANEPTLIEIPVEAMPDPWKILQIR